MINLVRKLGLGVSWKKVVSPTKHVTCGLLCFSANLFAKQKFDADKHFTRDSFVLNADCSLTICFRWSKTMQCQEREVRVTLPALHPHRLCPVSAVCQALRAAVHQSPKAPAFPVSGAVFDKKLKAVTQGEANLSGHSFRRGGACWALSQNIPGEIIKIMGDWKSTAYMSYTLTSCLSRC